AAADVSELQQGLASLTLALLASIPYWLELAIGVGLLIAALVYHEEHEFWIPFAAAGVYAIVRGVRRRREAVTRQREIAALEAQIAGAIPLLDQGRGFDDVAAELAVTHRIPPGLTLLYLGHRIVWNASLRRGDPGLEDLAQRLRATRPE